MFNTNRLHTEALEKSAWIARANRRPSLDDGYEEADNR